MPQVPFDFQVHRDDPRQHRLLTPRQPTALAAGQAVLRIERFALSTQDLAYGRLGRALPYWQLFPAPPPWGRLPVWGYAEVTASTDPAVPVGERVFGCLPMARWLLVRPSASTASQFVDASESRQTLPTIYNTYARSAADPSYRVAFEDQQMLLQPAFTTAFIFERHLAERQFFDARQIVVTSASSKAAAALAFLLRHERRTDCRIVGLTSTKNRRLVQTMGYYDEVVDYARLTAMSPGVPTVFIDLTGNPQLREAVHRHFGDAIRFECHVDEPATMAASTAGMTGPSGGDATPMPATAMTGDTFGPTQWRALIDRVDLQSLRDALTQAWNRFVDACAYWLRIDEHRGAEALTRLYDSLRANRTDPARGHVIVLDN